MASITTSVPAGPIPSLCIQNLYADFDSPDFASCANSKKGTMDADFESICCDGEIIDKTQDLWHAFFNRQKGIVVELSNLVCCRVLGPQQGGIQPIISGNGQTCTSGTPTPLASLAATNTANAQIYPVTYVSASGEAPNIGDFLFTQTPQCLWAYTAHNVSLTQVTVPAASISKLPVGWPDSDDPLIYSTPLPWWTSSAAATYSSRTGSGAGSTTSMPTTEQTMTAATAMSTSTSTPTTTSSASDLSSSAPKSTLLLLTVVLMFLHRRFM